MFCWFYDEDDTIKDFSVLHNMFAQRNFNITIKDVIEISQNHEIIQDIHSSQQCYKWIMANDKYVSQGSQ